jgi:acetyltransferase-like isoleucine patch superfamily enzyme
MNYFVHDRALCESTSIGEGSRVWAFAHILPGAVIGREANICDGVFVENDVVVGDRVTVKCGVQLWDGVTLEDDVFVGPNATFTNDRFPRSKQYPQTFARTIVRRGASLGANSTILPGVEIGAGAMVGAGAVVTRDVPPNAIVVGNPARIRGYVDSDVVGQAAPGAAAAPAGSRVTGAALLPLRRVDDLRGSLVAGEFGEGLPFVPQRVFSVFGVPSREVRGAHAHKHCEQFLVCLAGSVRTLVDDGTNRAEFVLDRPDVGLHMSAMVWGSQYAYSPDAVLLVLASDPYDADDYIRDYEEFREIVSSSPRG